MICTWSSSSGVYSGEGVCHRRWRALKKRRSSGVGLLKSGGATTPTGESVKGDRGFLKERERERNSSRDIERGNRVEMVLPVGGDQCQRRCRQQGRNNRLSFPFVNLVCWSHHLCAPGIFGERTWDSCFPIPLVIGITWGTILNNLVP